LRQRPLQRRFSTAPAGDDCARRGEGRWWSSGHLASASLPSILFPSERHPWLNSHRCMPPCLWPCAAWTESGATHGATTAPPALPDLHQMSPPALPGPRLLSDECEQDACAGPPSHDLISTLILVFQNYFLNFYANSSISKLFSEFLR
jgi:hypothetical protein